MSKSDITIEGRLLTVSQWFQLIVDTGSEAPTKIKIANFNRQPSRLMHYDSLVGQNVRVTCQARPYDFVKDGTHLKGTTLVMYKITPVATTTEATE